MSDAQSTPDPADEQDDSAVQRLADRAGRDGFERTVGEIVARGLTSETDPYKAVRNLMQMLTRYVGDWDAAFVLVSLLGAQPGTGEVEDAYASIGDDVAREHLREIVERLGALYGEEIQVGLDLSSRNPNDWKYIRTRTLYELESGVWTIEVSLRRFDEQEIVIAGDPLSILRLSNYLLGALRDVAPQVEDFSALMEPDVIADFGELAATLTEVLRPADFDPGIASFDDD